MFRRTVGKAGPFVTIGIGTEITGGQNIVSGDHFILMKFASLYAHDGYISIGDNVAINSNTCVGASEKGEVVIGNDVIIGQNVVIRASDHRHDSVAGPIIQQGHAGGRIVIEDDVWVGANAVITSNVTIGTHSIVGAGAVVTGHVEPYSVVGGVPAKLIKKRK